MQAVRPLESPVPALFLPPGLNDATVGAGLTVTAEFRWPDAYFVEGLYLAPLSVVTEAAFAALQVRIVDETADDLIASADARLVGFFAPSVALCGRRPLMSVGARPYLRKFPLQRPVVGGDLWQISLRNVGGVGVRAHLSFAVGHPYEDAR